MGSFKEVFAGNFDLSKNVYIDNTNIDSLDGSPQKIESVFSCAHNKLTTLEGGPEFVGSSYVASGNKNLKTLKGIAKYIGKDLMIRDCPKLSLESLDELLDTEIKGRILADFNTDSFFRDQKMYKKMSKKKYDRYKLLLKEF